MPETIQTPSEDASRTLARYVTNFKFEELPPSVTDIVKKCTLDLLGVSMAASGTMPEVKKLAALMKKTGGRRESTVIGYGNKIPAWHAGYLNGAMAHFLDYDDLYVAGGGHISASIVPAAFAMSERKGNVSGKEFITAVALGMDVFNRLSLSVIKRKLDWNVIPVMGVYGGAAAAGRILGLSEEDLWSAFGIAFTRSSGTMEMIYGLDSNIRGMYNAPAGEEGVRAPLLAQLGIIGVRKPFEGTHGLFNVFFKGECDRSALIGELGKRFASVNIGFKPWPSNGTTHVFIDMTLQLMKEHDLRVEDVKEIMVTVGDFSRTACEPWQDRREPKTTMNGKYAIPFTIAIALVRGKVLIGDFLPPKLFDPAVTRLAQRISHKYDSAYDVNLAVGEPPGKIEITTRDGKVLSKRQDIAYGHHEKPMSWGALKDKFRDCATYSAKPVSKENVEKTIDMITGLDKVEDVGEILKVAHNGG